MNIEVWLAGENGDLIAEDSESKWVFSDTPVVPAPGDTVLIHGNKEFHVVGRQFSITSAISEHPAKMVIRVLCRALDVGDHPDPLANGGDSVLGADEPPSVPFMELETNTRQTVRHERQKPFMLLVAHLNQEIQRLPDSYEYREHLGSVSWLGSDERSRQYLGSSNDLTIWKLCYYGQSVGGQDQDYAFGLRIRYAQHFAQLAQLSCWQFRFQVPPNYAKDKWFVGFSVRATQQSLALIREIVDVVIAELRDNGH